MSRFFYASGPGVGEWWSKRVFPSDLVNREAVGGQGERERGGEGERR